MKARTKILIAITALWMAFIFFLSGQSQESSSKASDSVTSAIVELVDGEDRPQSAEEAGYNFTDEVIEDKLNKGVIPRKGLFGRSNLSFNHDIRKLAHLFLYFVLAVLISTSFISHYGKYRVLNVAITFVICCTYAALDELHQLFVPGRGAQLSDVAIDVCGAAVGIVFLAFIVLMKNIISTIFKKIRG